MKKKLQQSERKQAKAIEYKTKNVDAQNGEIFLKVFFDRLCILLMMP